MYLVWFVVYASLPVLLLPGMLGAFGPEASEVACDVLTGAVVLLIIFGIYLGLRYFGVL
jgi:hypothetical protein